MEIPALQLSPFEATELFLGTAKVQDHRHLG